VVSMPGANARILARPFPRMTLACCRGASPRAMTSLGNRPRMTRHVLPADRTLCSDSFTASNLHFSEGLERNFYVDFPEWKMQCSGKGDNAGANGLN